MKNILLILVFTLASLTAYGVINAPMSNQIDVRDQLSRKDKKFIKVFNNLGSDIASGTIVVYDYSADDANKGGYATTVASLGHPAACVAIATMTAGTMNNCQVYGHHSAVLFDSSNCVATRGQAAYLSGDTAGYAAAIGCSGGGATAVPIGIFFDDSASGSVDLFLNIN